MWAISDYHVGRTLRRADCPASDCRDCTRASHRGHRDLIWRSFTLDGLRPIQSERAEKTPDDGPEEVDGDDDDRWRARDCAFHSTRCATVAVKYHQTWHPVVVIRTCSGEFICSGRSRIDWWFVGMDDRIEEAANRACRPTYRDRDGIRDVVRARGKSSVAYVRRGIRHRRHRLRGGYSVESPAFTGSTVKPDFQLSRAGDAPHDCAAASDPEPAAQEHIGWVTASDRRLPDAAKSGESTPTALCQTGVGQFETFDIVAQIVDNRRHGIDIRGAMMIALQKLSCPMPIPRLVASLSKQTLTFIRGGDAVRTYPISTAKNGAGERMGSGCTPRGQHVIRAKIGASCPVGTVFVGRRATGEIYSVELAERLQGRDWILTRILWLRGCEPGRNRFGEVDTMRRYIYIHGCPDIEPMGVPASHGCIRMRNADIAELFDLVESGTSVLVEQ